MNSIGLAFAPVIAICIFIYWKDKFEKEPKKLLIFCFFLGAISTIPALLLEIAARKILLPPVNLLLLAVYSWAGIGIIEEGCKYFFIRIVPYRNKSFNEPFDGITYSVMVSMGFAGLENLSYILEGGPGVGIIRMLTAIPAHASFGIIMGYYLGLQKMNGDRNLGLKGLLFAATLHAAYDFFLLADSITGMWVGALISLIAGVNFSLRAIKLHQNISPFKV